MGGLEIARLKIVARPKLEQHQVLAGTDIEVSEVHSMVKKAAEIKTAGRRDIEIAHILTELDERGKLGPIGSASMV